MGAGRHGPHHSARKETPRFRGYLTVQLASLGGPEYRLSPGKDAPLFRVFRFGVKLRTDKKVYAPGEKSFLEFQVENLMGTPQPFLKWHTPFEGFRNDFLEIERVGGEKVGYSGVITLIAVGCSDLERRAGVCSAGLITGAVSVPVTAFALWLLVDSGPKAHVLPVFKARTAPGQPPVSLAVTPNGVIGTF